MKISIQDIVNHYQQKNYTIYNLEGFDVNLLIDSPRSILAAKQNHISFIGKKYLNDYISLVSECSAPILFIDATFDVKQLPNTKIYIVAHNPKQEIIDFSKHFLGFQQQAKTENIHPSATIHSSVKLGKNIIINPNVVIEAGSEIGDYCIIGANTVIKENTIIKNNVEIGSNNVIGGSGFGYVQNKETQVYEQFPHFGSVIIHDNVAIGNNNCIDRGALSDTIIYEGVKIDNLVHIAHNVEIGKNTLVIAQSMIAGSVKIGENCWIAPHACINNNLSVGNNVTIGLASSVFRSVPNNETMVGSPAMTIKDYSAITRHNKKLLKK